MSQIFHKSFNTIAKICVVCGIVFFFLLVWFAYYYNGSPYITKVGVMLEQPILFSHKLHDGELGIDCRFCHTSSEESPYAGVPETKVCMNCHSLIYAKSPALQLLEESSVSGAPVEWNRVNDLPDFVYFDHSIHVRQGVSCFTCHGNVHEMSVTQKANTLSMKWCLDCHRNPQIFVTARENVFDPNAKRETDGRDIVKEYNIKTSSDCSICHQ